MADQVAARTGLPTRVAWVACATPSVREALDTLAADGVRRVAVAPYLLARGRVHDAVARACEDWATTRPGRRARLGGLLHETDALVDVVLDRAGRPRATAVPA